MSEQQAAVRAGVFVGQAGQLLVEGALVESAVDQLDVLNMPRAMSRHEGAHQGSHIIELGRPPGLDHRSGYSVAWQGLQEAPQRLSYEPAATAVPASRACAAPRGRLWT